MAESSLGEGPSETTFAEVAVPVPLAGPLTYRVPDEWVDAAKPGCRVRVGVGKRRLVGVILRLSQESPDLERVLPLNEVLDREPVLNQEMMDLAAFVSEYYLAPIGETIRSILPRQLPAWGDEKVSITRRGAFAQTTEPAERELLDLLLEKGTLRISAIAKQSHGPELLARLDTFRAKGFVSTERSSSSGTRYRSAVELPEGDLAAQKEACGRSLKGREVVDYLAALERPATVQELTSAVDCGPGVVRSLVKKGILRSFTQLERLALDRHQLAGETGAADFELNEDQKAALKRIMSALETSQFQAFLLKGLTSSGKTEVYLRAVDRVLVNGGTAILLVPEISLVPALATEARRRFGDRLAILHSGLSAAERSQEWERARSGLARVVLGPRSAVLAPLENLGLIVVDEEQDASYKQDITPRYNGRDLALVRARSAGAVAVLVSATPSLETRYNVERGKVESLVLASRVAGGQLPEGILVDLREEKTPGRRPGELCFSQRLRTELEQTIERGEQAILLRNRRGYAPILLCRACGEQLECDQCGLPRTFHKGDRRLVCHYCGSTRPEPKVCPSCGASAFDPVGAGTERVEETFRDLFPGVTVDVLDRDAGRRIGGLAAVLERFRNGSTQVLIGTQMVSKGHHFPRVTLTGVLSADSYLGFPDFRAVEKTYALLTQLGGRAGRGESPGKLVIQTYHPQHYAIRAALEHDDERFADEEMRFRRTFHYPPFTRMIQLVFRGRDRQRTHARVQAFAKRLYAHPLAAETRISGPAPAPLERLKGYWRFQILARQTNARRLRRLVTESLDGSPTSDLVVDVDPQDLL